MVPLRPAVPPSIGALCISGTRLRSTGFYSQVLRGLLFLALMPQFGEPDVGGGPHISQGGPLHLRYTLSPYFPLHGYGTCLFCLSPHLAVLMVLF